MKETMTTRERFNAAMNFKLLIDSRLLNGQHSGTKRLIAGMMTDFHRTLEIVMIFSVTSGLIFTSRIGLGNHIHLCDSSVILTK